MAGGTDGGQLGDVLGSGKGLDVGENVKGCRVSVC